MVPGLVAQISRTAKARIAVVASDLEELRAPVKDALGSAGMKFVEDPSPQSIAQADLGVSRAALAIAETGSVVVAGNDLLSRLTTMLPLIHVVLVDVEKMAKSLDDAGEFLRRIALGGPAGPVRYASFVSGPSRTADVEKTLSTGVHGPRELHVILMP